ncbi:MAG: hypothetical protein A3K19_30875 [Lentisphaerae bacterium RIFOXYB12_FULL_65_16]|nr:MAG: hypothetical protein A3K18_04020 [Lentisphaerae bacterium RIFOXYA12_64_32]OGV88822.1 MAG: hypothetical protein A3K19_30875 [Lentisphaerae bacterium RIFOXYB12_FULL_65_16]
MHRERGPDQLSRADRPGTWRRIRLASIVLCLAALLVRGEDVAFNLTLHNGWNFVAIPVVPVDASVDAVFQRKNTGPVWQCQGGGFQAVEQITAGTAYWVLCRFPGGRGQEVVTIHGTAIDPDAATLTAGWNAIGGRPDYARPGRSKVLPRIWGWNAGLQRLEAVPGTTLTPGQGYWMYAKAPGPVSFRGHTITGTITGVGVAGVTLTLTGPGVTQTVSDGSGAFSFTTVADDTYQLVPSATGYAFQPPSLDLTVSGGDVNVNFISRIEGMGLIPAGTFQMGDAMQPPDSIGTLEQLHTVQVSAFSVGQSEATNQEVYQVMQWAYDHGKIDATTATVQNKTGTAQELLNLDGPGCYIIFYDGHFSVQYGKEGYPCVQVTWYGAAAYANYRSEKEGRETCYNLTDWTCDFSKHGYRLPTEAEWEKAARGGLVDKRFPWGVTLPSNPGIGDIISHDLANYLSNDGYAYDTSTTRGLHPLYNGDPAPGGAFAANAYGLYDSTGNVWEWCYDRYDSQWYTNQGATTENTTGPASGSSRVIRGGSAADYADKCRCAARGSKSPGTSNSLTGFRVVLR